MIEPAKNSAGFDKLAINKGCNLSTYVGKARLGKRALHCRFATPGFLDRCYLATRCYKLQYEYNDIFSVVSVSQTDFAAILFGI
ncbi:MAG: hypothetical protein GY777_26510 [Candidatus Brocadiaceae bacterium]|nr:hypothetical protein [Candidatus Brocadiaceae bacterium]